MKNNTLKIINKKFKKLVQPEIDKWNKNLKPLQRIGGKYYSHTEDTKVSNLFQKIEQGTLKLNLESFQPEREYPTYVCQLELTPVDVASILESDEKFKEVLIPIVHRAIEYFYSSGIKLTIPYFKDFSSIDGYFFKDVDSENLIAYGSFKPAKSCIGIE